ncbi:MAG: hypothetical protein ACRDJL_12315, partial [Actinomycetota bacterium]
MGLTADALRRKRKRRPARASSSEWRLAVAFLLPALILVTVLVYVPVGRAAYDSLFARSFFGTRPRFVGLEQYTDIFRDPIF